MFQSSTHLNGKCPQHSFSSTCSTHLFWLIYFEAWENYPILSTRLPTHNLLPVYSQKEGLYLLSGGSLQTAGSNDCIPSASPFFLLSDLGETSVLSTTDCPILPPFPSKMAELRFFTSSSSNWASFQIAAVRLTQQTPHAGVNTSAHNRIDTSPSNPHF